MSAPPDKFDALKILRQHNIWRRGDDEDLPMLPPDLIGHAIDAAIEELTRLRKIEEAAVRVVDCDDKRLIPAITNLFRVIRRERAQ